MKYNNPTIGIFRAIDVRFPHAEFAASFKDFRPVFVANIPLLINKFLKGKNISHNDVQLVPQSFIDPVFPVLKKTDFTPWLKFNPEVLQKVSARLDVFEIYEPYFFYSSQVADLAKQKDKPLITELWTSFPEHPSRYIPPYNFITRNVVQKTDLFILRSQKAADFLRPYKIPETKKQVVYHGVNVKRFNPGKKPHEKITILFVGALASHKGLDDLLSVFPELVSKYPNRLEFVICGSGPMRDLILQAAKELPINFKGHVDYELLPSIYQHADIYCQPSKDYYFFGIKGGEEFAGYTFMEAMASGLPIVSTYCGGIPEIVGKDNALTTQGNKEELFNSLNAYISNKSLRKEIGIKNRLRAETFFDLSKQVHILEKIIKEKLI